MKAALRKLPLLSRREYYIANAHLCASFNSHPSSPKVTAITVQRRPTNLIFEEAYDLRAQKEYLRTQKEYDKERNENELSILLYPIQV